MEKRAKPTTKEQHVLAVLDSLLDDFDPGIISRRDIVELRALRDRCQEMEAGLSLGRRLAQGRLDIVMAELERRGGGAAGLIERLPEVLAKHTRGSGPPRPVRDTELPAFTDDIAAALEELLPAEQLGHLDQVDPAELDAVIERLRDFEQEVSRKRHELHRVIDDLQEEIVGRYRSGAASVDDLLR
ncbi:MAG: hypothetical protein IT195_09500 [Microthrixaceae bacterium]|nr:hypothetical protein [Microthrixaceae bacterium]